MSTELGRAQGVMTGTGTLVKGKAVDGDDDATGGGGRP
jgi:hypothetical protein